MKYLQPIALGALVLSHLFGGSLVFGDGPGPAIEAASGTAEVFQYAVAAGKNDNSQDSTAYLWLPPKAVKVRGVIVGGNVLLEPNFVVDPVIRRACAEIGLAIVYFSPHFAAKFEWQQTDCEAQLLKALADLAKASNHPELADAPLVPIGHSVASLFAQRVFNWQPQRCLAVITYKGALATEVELAGDAALRGVPTLHTTDFIAGESPEGKSGSQSRELALGCRARSADLLMGLIEENGGRHGTYSFRLPEMFAEFLRASAKLRLDAQGRLRPVKASEGVLIDAQMEKPRFPAAKAGEYQGKPEEALWFPSMELAQAVERFNRTQFNRKTRDFAFVSDLKTGTLMENVQGEIKPQWIGPDTFEVQARTLDGKEAPIRLLPSCRQLEQVGPNRFRFRYNPRAARWPVLLGIWDGDEEYRYIERVKRVATPWKKGPGCGAWTTPGTDRNNIEFTPPPTVRRSEFPLKLEATSSSKLPVRFTVNYGPVRIESEDTLVLADWPARAQLPMSLEIIAWQLGSHIEPKIPPAAPVRRVITMVAEPATTGKATAPSAGAGTRTEQGEPREPR
jgi:hypothetical protein